MAIEYTCIMCSLSYIIPYLNGGGASYLQEWVLDKHLSGIGLPGTISCSLLAFYSCKYSTFNYIKIINEMVDLTYMLVKFHSRHHLGYFLQHHSLQ